MYKLILIFGILGMVLSNPLEAQDKYKLQEGSVHFMSDAPLEIIEATTHSIRGVIDPEERNFAFSVKVSAFEGFNSPLQRVHFNENYMESLKFPAATFAGKIIEDISLLKPGRYIIRAKGKLLIHGVEQERIIKSEVVVGDRELRLQSRFSVLLEEHNISIPRIVYQKIAEEIMVDVNAVFIR